MTKDALKIKLNTIRWSYGALAYAHFSANPVCSSCGEDRLVTLAIHHVEGKSVEKFDTLCHNCHAVHHAKNGQATAKSVLEDRKIREAKTRERLAREEAEMSTMRQYLLDGLSMRTVGRLLGVSQVAIKRRAAKIGLKFHPRKSGAIDTSPSAHV